MLDSSDCLRAQNVINQACQKALKRKKPPHSHGKWQSLEDRLLDCYIESCEGAPKDKRFCHGVRLLEKIVLQDNLSTLVVNLYPGNEGYSLMLRGKNGTDSETVRLPYEESEFLDYLDAQELPPILVDLLERSQVNVFYSGCVIVEVRDFRQSAMATSYDSYYVLLQPTYQTLICDVNAMTSESTMWTQEDKFALEAQLLLATERPLCLDPTPEVARVSNQLQFNYNKLNSPGLKRAVRKHSQAFRNRSTLISLGPAPPTLKLLDFLSHYKKPQPPVNLRLAKTPQTVDTWKQKTVNLPLPSRVDVDLHGKMLESPKMTCDNTAEIVQEITLEGEKTNNRNYFCRVTIRQRPTDLQYLGELYLEEDTGSGNGNSVPGVEGSNRNNGKSCQFMIGSKLSAQKYLQQFQDLYTEEGRKSVKICSYIPNSSTLSARVVSHTPQLPLPTTTHVTTGTATAINSSNVSDPQSRSFVSSSSMNSSTGSNGHLAVASGVSSVTVNLSSSSIASFAQHSVVQTTPSLSAMRTFGQKLALISQHQQQQPQQQQQQQASGNSSAQYATSTGSSVSLAGSLAGITTKTATGAATNASHYLSTVQSSSHIGSMKSVSAATVAKSTPNTVGRQISIPESNSRLQSPTSATPSAAPYPGVVTGTYVQPVVGNGGVNVTVPTGVTVTVAGATPIVPATNSTPTSLPAQFIAAAQPIQPAPPLALLQPQQGQLAQGRQGGTTFTIPTNFVPITQIPSIGVATIGAQIQPKASPQSTPTCQPMPILPNTPLSPPSGTMTTVTLARSILPQQQQQTRKISPANRTSQNLQPLVPIGSQLPPQQQFQVRMVQFSQPQPRQAQIQPQQQSVVQTQIPAQAIQIQGQPTAMQVIQSQVAQGTQAKQNVQTRTSQQVQGAQTNSKPQGKLPAPRRRSQSKST